MKANIIVLIALNIHPVVSTSTGQPALPVPCPSLSPNQHVSQFHCRTADGSLIHVDGPGPFNCEISYIAIRPQTGKDTTTNESAHCELRIIQFTNDGVVRHGCCKDGIAVFETQNQQDSSSQFMESLGGIQKPMQCLQTDDQVVDRKLQIKSEGEPGFRYENEDEDYEGEDDDDDDDDDEEGEYEDDDEIDYGVNEGY